MPTFNGHKNWNFWNVSLWLNNDEHLYRRAIRCLRVYGIDEGTDRLYYELPERTPDGAPYTKTSIRAALRGMR